MRKLLHRFLVAAVAAALIPACGGGGSGSDSPPLSAPPGLFRATWGNAEVTLTWLTSSGAGSYNVYRATSCDGPYTLVVNVTGTTYTDSVGLSNGTTYYYTVRSVSGGAESAPAIPQSGIPNPVPPAPASVNATAGERKVDLTWSPVGGATGYAIDRASAPGGAYRRVDTVGSSATTYSSTGLSAGVPYYFVVRALNGSVVGPPSSEVTATPTPPPAPPPFPAFNQARGFNGVMDPLWSPIYTLAKAADGSGDIYVGGGMSTYGSSAVPVLVRLNADGTMDSGFSVSFSASGTVHVITPATDGSGDVYVGGWFSTVNGAPANNIVRLNSNGSTDPGFSTGTGIGDFDASVSTIVLAGDGSGDVYVGGDFRKYNGANAFNLVRVNSNGSRDTSFDIGWGFDAAVHKVVLANDGSNDIWVAGAFRFMDLASVHSGGLIRLRSDGSVARSFGAGFQGGGGVSSILLTDCGDLYVAGGFSTYDNGLIRRPFVRLKPDDSLDPGFSSPFFSATDLTWAPDGSGKIYLGVLDPSAQGLYRIHPDGVVDDSFGGTPWVAYVGAVLPVGDGSNDVYVGGGFAGIHGTGIDRLARINADGTVDPALPHGSGFNAHVTAVLPAEDGTDDVYVAGSFVQYNGKDVRFLARLDSNGTQDPGFASQAGTWVNDIARATDGSGDLFVGGSFTTYGGTASSYIARINADGSRDASFSVGSSLNGTVSAVAPAVDGSGDVYASGIFTTHQGTTVNRIIRFNPNGTRDLAFATGAGFNSGTVGALAAATDGSFDVYAGGTFTQFNGSSANRIARLNSNGTLDGGFASGTGFAGVPSPAVSVITPGPGGDVYVGGEFTTYNGTAATRIVRLNGDGSIDSGFSTGSGFDETVYAIKLASDGSGDVYVAGDFTSYNGTAAKRIVRLNSDGSMDTAFDMETGFNGPVYTLAPLPDGRVYAGGLFTVYQTTTVDRMARIQPDGTVE